MLEGQGVTDTEDQASPTKLMLLPSWPKNDKVREEEIKLKEFTTRTLSQP